MNKYITGGSAAKKTFGRTRFDALDDTFLYPGNAGKVVTVRGDESGLTAQSEAVIDSYEVKANGTDPLPGFLFDKLIEGLAILIAEDNTNPANHKVSIAVDLGTQSDQACAGNDPRLSDARVPLSHASTHEGGSDPMTVDASPATGSLRTLGTLSDQAAAGNHNHGTGTPGVLAMFQSDQKSFQDSWVTNEADHGISIAAPDASSHNYVALKKGATHIWALMREDTTEDFKIVSDYGNVVFRGTRGGTTYLPNLTVNGFVKTTGGTGQLTVLTDQYAASPHALAGADHSADSITNLNTKLSDGDVISTKAGEIAALTAKTPAVAADFLMIEDSADTNNKKRINVSDLPAAAPAAHALAGALHSADTITNLNTKLSDGDVISTKAAEISAITEKTTPVSADLLLIEDSADTNNKKRLQIGNLMSGMQFPIFQYFADNLRSPWDSEFPVNGNNMATAANDPSNGAFVVRQFDDTTEEGVAFDVRLPPGAVNIVFLFVSRANTAPGAAKQVVPAIYYRTIGDNAAVGAWSARTALTAIDIPTNARFQYDTQTISFSTLSLTAGNLVQFELCRYPAHASDNLVGDWNLGLLRVSFT